MTDWRETLFIWDGILGRYENDHNDNKNSGKDDITWKGTWIGYSNAADATEGEQMKGSTSSSQSGICQKVSRCPHNVYP